MLLGGSGRSGQYVLSPWRFLDKRRVSLVSTWLLESPLMPAVQELGILWLSSIFQSSTDPFMLLTYVKICSCQLHNLLFSDDFMDHFDHVNIFKVLLCFVYCLLILVCALCTVRLSSSIVNWLVMPPPGQTDPQFCPPPPCPMLSHGFSEAAELLVIILLLLHLAVNGGCSWK